MGNKNKPKDIHLASIDVNFGSLRILFVFLPLSLFAVYPSFLFSHRSRLMVFILETTSLQYQRCSHSRSRTTIRSYRSKRYRKVDLASKHGSQRSCYSFAHFGSVSICSFPSLSQLPLQLSDPLLLLFFQVRRARSTSPFLSSFHASPFSKPLAHLLSPFSPLFRSSETTPQPSNPSFKPTSGDTTSSPRKPRSTLDSRPLRFPRWRRTR